MRTFFALLTAAILVSALGCNQGTPGGPGVKAPPPASSSSTTSTMPPSSETTETTSSETKTTTTETTSATEPTGSTDKPAAAATPPEKAPAGTDANPLAGDPENTFRLTTPTLATHAKQGEKKIVTIGITRAKNFDQDVTLKFTDIPKGVTIEPEEPVIKRDEKEVKVNISVAEDTGVNDFTIKIIGHPATGADATNELKLTIDKP